MNKIFKICAFMSLTLCVISMVMFALKCSIAPYVYGAGAIFAGIAMLLIIWEFLDDEL